MAVSLYEMAFPDPARSDRVVVLCRVAGVEPDAFARLRDAWVESVDGRLQLAFYTRIGGDLRANYTSVIDALRAHPLYFSDRDDQFDRTYATFRFLVDPVRTDASLPGLYESLRVVAHDGEVDTDQRWRDAIAGEIQPATLAKYDQLMAAIHDTTKGDGPRIIEI